VTVIAALTDLYERLARQGQVAEPGYAPAKISYELILDPAGEPVELADVRTVSGKTRRPRTIRVPVPAETRTSGIKPMFLWDKTAYVLGLVNVAGKGAPPEPDRGRRTDEEHAAFAALHRELLAGTDDPGLVAVLGFLDRWRPEMFAERGFPPEALDQNLVIRLDGERGHVHDRPAAKRIWSAARATGGDTGLCLATGERAPLARTHPSIRGVQGAQTSGAALVSFNQPAFESHGHAQGLNAPVSDHAAFAYTTALNWLLTEQTVRIGDRSRSVAVDDERRPSGRRRMVVADTTVVFWADAGKVGEAAASLAEDHFAALFAPSDAGRDAQENKAEANRVRDALALVAKGRPVEALDAGLHESTRMYLLALAPNAARLSVRFWHVDTFGNLVRNLANHWQDMAIEPAGWRTAPAVWSVVLETALQGKADNVPPRLAGEVMQAVVTGRRYPTTLLSGVIRRVRADGRINGRRAAICRAVVVRARRLEDEARHPEGGTLPAEDKKEEDIPVALDRDNPNPAYRLGRLFAMLESVQSSALPGLNATIKDRYFAAACATPARVFPLLNKNAMHHLSQLRKAGKGGLARWLDREIGEIWAGLDDDLPRSVRLEDQGRFVVGYYHQRYARKPAGAELPDDPADAPDAGPADEAAPELDLEE